MMRRAVLIYVFLVEVNSQNPQQTYPYFSFMGQTLANHSYVDITTVGASDNDSIQCITDLSTCCSGAQGTHRGDWYFPNGTRVKDTGVLFVSQHAQRVDLHQLNNTVIGLYHCNIPTINVNDPNDFSVGASIYIGLYPRSEGELTIADISFDPEKLIVNCISTGGPATTVTWTRDSTIITEGTETVLNDPITARYTHTLSVVTGGQYSCNVSNNKPSSDSSNITLTSIPPPTNVVAVQSSATTISMTWTPPSPPEDITGYIILYNSEGGGINEIAIANSSETSYSLTGLSNSESYTVAIRSISSNGLLSETVLTASINLVPDTIITLNTQPEPVVRDTTIRITGSLSDPGDSVVTGYVVEWTRDTSIGCSDRNKSIITETGSFTSYTITGLEPGNRYTVTVRLSNDAGNGPASNNITETTLSRAPTGAPTSFRAGAVTSNSVIVHWDEVPCLDRNGEITNYTLRTIDRDGIVHSNPSVSGSARQATVTGLNSFTRYFVHVAAVNSAGTGSIANPLRIDTLRAPVLTFSHVSPTSLNLSLMLDRRTTATLFTIVYYNINNECLSDSATIITVPETPYTLTGLQEGSQYSVTVTATVPGGIEEATITPTTMTDVAAAPSSNVRIIGMTSSTITVQWGPVEPCRDRNGEITGYSVRYDNKIMEVSGDFSGGMTIISGLSPSTTYSIQVAAVNSAGTGVYSDSIDVTTLSSVYLTLNGDFIPNHGYVLMSDIGSTDDTALLCHTNNPPSPGETNSGGDWFYPNGTAVDSTSSSLERNRASMLVRLRRSGDPSEEGIYWCKVKDAANVSQKVYVGLYHGFEGMISIQDSPMFNTSQIMVQYTFTCISTGGPATTITWTRDSTILIEGAETVLNDPITATYTHTLTVDVGLPGLYTCTVSNGKPSNNSSSLFASQASPPTNVVAVQSSATSITVTWTPPSPLGNTTGYNITFTGEGQSTTEHVQSRSATSYELSGLQNGVTYAVSIIAISAYFPSNDITIGQVILISVPGEVTVEVVSITATSISLSWSVASGSVSSWEVVWRETDGGTESSSGSLPGTSYTIDQLDSTTNYSVRVTATNVAGTNNSGTLFIKTTSTGTSSSNSSALIAGTVSVLCVIMIVLVSVIVVIILLVIRKRNHSEYHPSTSDVKTNTCVVQEIELNTMQEPKEPMHEDIKQICGTSNSVNGATSDKEYYYAVPCKCSPPSNTVSDPNT